MNLYINTGSVTLAQRGADILRKNGYKPAIKRIVNTSKTGGCGYTIVVESENEEPIEILEQNRIRVKSVERR